ncbi:leucine-rich repeat- and IQ domain-containing protein 1-like [Mytilus edulis]|uniref:leucine-rich repeat- and IQ domain-containing protein 1-like n=1 Tax=Mytilus edulis TaxID=6550 RepID=UPI0039F126E6
MESDEEAFIEVEIQKGLDKLTEADLESSDTSASDVLNSDNSSSEDVNEVLPGEFDTYVKSLQQQTAAFELDLAECDDLLRQSVDITSSRDVIPFDEDLQQDITEYGENIEDLRLKILEDLEKDDSDEDDDLFSDSEDDSKFTEEEEKEENKAMVLVTKEQLEFKELLAGQKDRIQEQSKKQEDQLNQLIERERHDEEIFEQEIETKKQEQKLQFEKEESRLLTERKGRQEEEEKQQKIIEQLLEVEMKTQQKKIEELEEIAKREKEEWEKRVNKEQIKQEEKKAMAAVKIQSVYKGYCTRKQHKTEIDKRWKEAQGKRREERYKEIEKEQKKFEEDEERQKIQDEEKRVKEEKRKEEERIKKEEEEKRKQEEADRKQREKEEKIKKEEEKRIKAEEEKLRKEEEKRKKEEEKKKKEEEKRQKQEEERQRKEEEKQKKKEEEERKKREEIERKQKEEEEKVRKQEEEKQKKLEKEKQEKEEKKKMKEDQQREEMERIRQEELKKQEVERQEAELKKQEEKLKQFLNEESDDTNDNKVIKSTDFKTNGSISHRDKNSPRKSVRRVKDGLVRDSTSASLNGDTDERLKNGLSSMMEGLPSHLESKRLGWIKSCTPWSKVSNEPWKLKASTSKRPPRRPSSAKKLHMLEESIITTAAKVASLRQVTTVELKDLPGSNMSTLGQCTGLQYLKMVNCNLIAVEGLQNCKQLQYLDLKNNKIEYIDLKSLGSIKFIDLSNNSLSGIHGMDGCTDVRWLDLSDNKITRLGGLNGLRRLHTLKLGKNQLINTSGLGDTPTIQYLDLSHNHLQEVQDINKLCLLQHLNLSANNLLQIPDLQNHVLLHDLILEDNNITSLDDLNQSWLPLVQKLNISQNSLEDLVSLENLLLLRDFNLSNNQVLDIDVFQSSLQSYIYLEMLHLCGNPAVESLEDKDSFRKKLTSVLTRLHQLDDATLESTQCGSPIKPRNSFEAMCLHQVQMMKDVHHRFQQDTKSHLDSSNLSELCEIYFKFCDKTHKMAEDNRYAHEYGEISIAQPTAPSTPKSGRPRSARANKVVQDSYMSPKDMFEKALHDGGSKGGGSNGLVRGDNVAVVKPVITAKIVQNILEDDTTSQKKLHRRHEAAVKIQSAWRGYSVRRWYEQVVQDQSFDMAVLLELHNAAIKIQAIWRGYSVRCRLERALDFAKLEDDDEFGEIDMNDLNFNEDILDDWKPPSTPQIPNRHAVLGKPPSGKKTTPPKIPALPLGDNPHPPQQPRRAWRGMDSPLSDVQVQQNYPRPPSSLISGTDTHRTVQSRKEEKISEEWGFKNNETAHLMMQRAKKMKYNAERRKKLSKLDPKQRLVLFRKLEEVSHYPHVQAPSRKILPRKEYFQERQKEIDNADREKRIEKSEKVSRTFEWLHTQVGDYDVSDSPINTNNQGNRTRQRFGSDGNLPKLDSDLMSGKAVRLVSSPVDLMSVDSVSIQGEFSKPRRFSASSSDSQTRLPPIKGGSAPTGQKRKEKMSWRNPQNKNNDIGWGGGHKRVVH